MTLIKAVSLLLLLPSVFAAVSISCPSLDCGMDIGERVCFLHSGSNPVSYIRLMQCDEGYYCDIGDEKRYAWVNAQSQKYTSGKVAGLS